MKNYHHILTLLVLIFIPAVITGCAESDSDSTGNAIVNGDEGTELNPVLIVVGAPRESSVGAYSTSYYRFVATSHTLYSITLSNTTTELSWTLYADDSLKIKIDDCFKDIDTLDTDITCVTDTDLQAGEMYFLEVDEWDTVKSTFTLLISEAAPAQ